MPYFTLHRNFTLRTTKGHTAVFVKDEPTWVPPMCVPDAVAIGAVSQDTVDILGEESPVVHLSPEEKEAKLFAAFEIMLNRSERSDFTASGAPHVKRLTKLCEFEVTNRERDSAWQTYSQKQADDE